MIAAFTGCRINEIAQLYVCDVYIEEGIWVFNLNEDTEDKSIKMDDPRVIPLHHQLIQIGLPEFIDDLKQKGCDRLFPELSYSNDGNGYARSIGEFCSELFPKLGVRGTMHCFRHSVTTLLTQADVELPKVQALVGHESGKSVTEEVYGANQFTVQQLKTAIDKLDYGFDFSVIRYNRFLTRTKAI